MARMPTAPPVMVALPYVNEGNPYDRILAHCTAEHVHAVSGVKPKREESPVHSVPLPDTPPLPCAVIAQIVLAAPRDIERPL